MSINNGRVEISDSSPDSAHLEVIVGSDGVLRSIEYQSTSTSSASSSSSLSFVVDQYGIIRSTEYQQSSSSSNSILENGEEEVEPVEEPEQEQEPEPEDPTRRQLREHFGDISCVKLRSSDSSYATVSPLPPPLTSTPISSFDDGNNQSMVVDDNVLNGEFACGSASRDSPNNDSSDGYDGDDDDSSNYEYEQRMERRRRERRRAHTDSDDDEDYEAKRRRLALPDDVIKMVLVDLIDTVVRSENAARFFGNDGAGVSFVVEQEWSLSRSVSDGTVQNEVDERMRERMPQVDDEDVHVERRRRLSMEEDVDLVMAGLVDAVIEAEAAIDAVGDDDNDDAVSNATTVHTAIELRRSTRITKPIDRWSYDHHIPKRRPRRAGAVQKRRRSRKPRRRVPQLPTPPPPPPAPRPAPFAVRAIAPLPPAPAPVAVVVGAIGTMNEIAEEVEAIEDLLIQFDFASRQLDIILMLRRLQGQLAKFETTVPTDAQKSRMWNAVARIKAMMGSN